MTGTMRKISLVLARLVVLVSQVQRLAVSDMLRYIVEREPIASVKLNESAW